MPSNKDLSDAILKLDPKAAVDNLSNQKLEALLSSLKSGAVPAAGASDTAPAPVAPSDPAVFDPEKVEAERLAKIKAETEAETQRLAEAAAAEEIARSGGATHKVAEGKAITCIRGVVPDFTGNDRVSVKDFFGKDEDLNRLVAAGVLVKL